MTLKKLVLGAAVASALSFAGAVAPASAVTVVPIAAADTDQLFFKITAATPSGDVIAANFGATVFGASTPFDYEFTFTLPQDGEGSGSLSTSFAAQANKLLISGVFINGTNYTGQLVTDAAGQGLTVNGVDITAGMLNTIKVVGQTDANAQFGTFTGTATFVANTAAVPEPATWAMMIAGFGLVGTALRRRRSTAAEFA